MEMPSESMVFPEITRSFGAVAREEFPATAAIPSRQRVTMLSVIVIRSPPCVSIPSHYGMLSTTLRVMRMSFDRPATVLTRSVAAIP